MTQSQIQHCIQHQALIANKLILLKWKMALESGIWKSYARRSAPLQSRLARVFSVAGMTIAEAYGLTETSPAISVNDLRNGGLKIGTVGKIIEGVEEVIAADGEILCKGPNVMKGYYKDPEQTSAVAAAIILKQREIAKPSRRWIFRITQKQMFKTSWR